MSVSSVLPFQIDFERSDLRTTSYKTTVTTTNAAGAQTTETKKKEVPLIAAGATLHNVLHCINEFYHAKKILNWTTGTKLFETIEDIFEDPQDQTQWATMLTTEPSRSVAQFNVFIKQYIADKFSNDTKAYRTHKRFLNAIKKTKHLSVHQFVSLVQYHNGNILPWLPGAPATAAEASYSSDDVKDIIFNSMPEEWRDGFDLVMDIDDATLPVLVKYMEKRNAQSKKTNKSSGGNPSSLKKNDSDTHSEGKQNNKRNGRNKGKRRGKSDQRNQQGRRQQNDRVQDNDLCPLPGHQGHTWGNCFQNVNNPNARGRNNNNNSNQNNNRNNNNNNDRNNRDNMVNENNNTNGSNGQNNQQQNPQQGDNYYCSFVEHGPKYSDYTDLFHVDCLVENNYYDEDPTSTKKNMKKYSLQFPTQQRHKKIIMCHRHHLQPQ